MKRTLALFFALTLSLSLCACSAGQNPEMAIRDILGEWLWVGDDAETITFNEDNTCLYSNGDRVKYSVDTDLDIITLYDDTTKNYDIVTENGIVKISGNKVYVRKENYEAAHAEYLADRQAKIAAGLQNWRQEFEAYHSAEGTKYVFGTTIKYTDVDVDFTILSAEFAPLDDEYMALWLTIRVDNNTDEVQWVRQVYPNNDVEYGAAVCSIGAGMQDVAMGDLQWEYAIDENGEPITNKVSPQSSITVRIPHGVRIEHDDFQTAIAFDGHLYGFSSFIMDEIAGDSYYFDFTEIPVAE